MSLDKGLQKACVGLGWDVSRRGASMDLDAWAIPVDVGGNFVFRDVVYFAHPRSKAADVYISPDNLTGEGEGDDETITFNLPTAVGIYTGFLIGVTIYRAVEKHQRIGDVDNMFIRIYDGKSGTELCKYVESSLQQFAKDTSVIFGYLYYEDSLWKFRAIGEGRNYKGITESSRDSTLKNLITKQEPTPTGANPMDWFTQNTNSEGDKKHMAVSLSKGGKVSLVKVAAEAGINRLVKTGAGLHWDVNRYDGGGDFDLDVMVFMTDANDKCPNEQFFVYYGNKTAPGVKHSGDERTGGKEGDDEIIELSLPDIPANIMNIYFCVTIYDAENRHQNFGMVENSGIHIYDMDTRTELVQFDLNEDYSSETAVVVGKLYRNNDEWKFSAIGSGFNQGMVALCANYGIDATA